MRPTTLIDAEDFVVSNSQRSKQLQRKKMLEALWLPWSIRYHIDHIVIGETHCLECLKSVYTPLPFQNHLEP